MAKYQAEIGNDILREMEKVHRDADKIFGAMTRAGAEAVAEKVRQNCPMEELNKHVEISRTYKTPSDDGINTKVYFSGFLPFKVATKRPRGGRKKFVRRGRTGSDKYETTKGVPAAFVAQVLEYGTSERMTDLGADRGSVQKQPFFRACFKKRTIEKAMLAAQTKESGGIL